MEWLWLFLGIAGLALLWLLIKWMDRLTERLRIHDEERKLIDKSIAERTAEAEAEFLGKEYVRKNAKDIVENAKIDPEDPEQVAMFQEAVNQLSAQDLIQATTKRMFGTPQELVDFTAKQSAFDKLQQPKKVVAKGDGITPIKVKPSNKSALSKAEQKMLKKIKQGD